MTAIGYTSGDPSKVDVAGDTMTGDLILAGATTDLTVGGVITDTYQGVSGDVMRFVSTGLSTGITSGGSITINANPTLVDIAPTTGWVVDYNSSGTTGPTNPQLTYVNFAGQTGIALTFPAVLTTWWLLSSIGTVVQQTTKPTPTQRRTHLLLGVTAAVGGTVVIVENLPVIQSQPLPQLYDLMGALGAFSVTNADNMIRPNGVNLSINTSGGKIFSPSLALPNYQDPHTFTLAAQTPATFTRATATAIVPAPPGTILDVANYDPNGAGVVTPVGGGVNTSTIFRVMIFGQPSVTAQMVIQYGQRTFNNLADAVAAIGANPYILNPALADGVLACYIAVIRTATDLSNPAQASFTLASKFARP